MRTRVLLSAFEAFAGRETNVSERLVADLRRAPPDGVAVAILPVDFSRLRHHVPRLLRRHRPLRWLMLGESTGNDALHCERIALNLLEGDLPDNRGRLPPGRRALRGAPDAYFTTLDPRWISARLAEAGIPAEVSHHAGTYACNLALFLALHHIERLSPHAEVGFVHVPRGYRRRGLTLTTLRAGLAHLVEDLLLAEPGEPRPSDYL